MRKFAGSAIDAPCECGADRDRAAAGRAAGTGRLPLPARRWRPDGPVGHAASWAYATSANVHPNASGSPSRALPPHVQAASGNPGDHRVAAHLDRGEPVADFASRWIADWAAANLALRTLRDYAGIYNRHLLGRVGHLQLRQVTPAVVDRLRSDLEHDGAGAPTVRKALAILQAMFRQAVIWGEVEANPVKAVRKPAGRRRRRVVALTVEQVEAVLAQLRDQAGADAAMLADSGARPQDALAVPYRHVGRSTVVYADKNVDGRIVPGAKTGADRIRSVGLLRHLRQDLLARRLAAGNPSAGALIVAGGDGAHGAWTEQNYRTWRPRA